MDNASDTDGGGVFLGGGWSTDIIQSSTVSGNSANGVGGGVLVRFAETTWTYFYLLNSTVANNVATGTGGGIEFEPAELGAQDVSLYSSIVAANFSVGTLEWNINAGWNRPDNPAVFNCVRRSFVYVAPGYPRPTDSGSCVFDVRNPLLGPLMPLGGDGDLPLHPLLAGSPAVDGAPDDTTPDEQRDDWIHDFDPATPPDWTLFDPLVDGDGDGTPVRDIGAYERNDRWQAELLAVRAQGASGAHGRHDPGRLRPRRRRDLRRDERDGRIRHLRAADRRGGPLRRVGESAHRHRRRRSSRSRSRTIRRGRGRRSAPSKTAMRRRPPSCPSGRSRRPSSRRPARSCCVSR